MEKRADICPGRTPELETATPGVKQAAGVGPPSTIGSLNQDLAKKLQEAARQGLDPAHKH